MRAFFVVACAGLFACSAAAEPGDTQGPVNAPHGVAAADPGPAPATEDGRDRARATTDRGLGLPGPDGPFVCRKGAFCDDFEAIPEQPLGARWSTIVQGGGGKMEVASESASVGKGALTLFTPDADSSVFLDQSKDGVGGSWSGLVAFAFKASAVPAAHLGGPELSLRTAEGAMSVRVSLRPEGLVLEQLAPASCGRERCRPSSLVIAPVKEGAWYRVRVGFEVNAQNAPPYGRIEATVDGGPLLVNDLDIPLYEGSVSLRAGITQGDTRRAIANLDDVTLLVR